jgi:GAF domain-containing protein
VEPIPETRDALRRMALLGEVGIDDQLARVTQSLSAVVPALVAFSVGIARHGVTLTYVSSRLEAARLDGVQYVDDGPCQQAARSGEVVAVGHDDLLDEGRWQLFAQAGATSGIRSTLSLPVLDSTHVIGGVNLYGSHADTFVGRHEEVAALVGGWAQGAVTNADLTFQTRVEATHAPQRLEEVETVHVAVGVLVEAKRVSADVAEAQLYEAAARAGIPVVSLALMVIGERDEIGGP